MEPSDNETLKSTTQAEKHIHIQRERERERERKREKSDNVKKVHFSVVIYSVKAGTLYLSVDSGDISFRMLAPHYSLYFEIDTVLGLQLFSCHLMQSDIINLTRKSLKCPFPVASQICIHKA